MAEDETTPPEDGGAPPVDDGAPTEEPAPEAPPESPPPGGPSLDDIAAQIRALPVGPFLLSTVSTLASIAYGKLEVGQLDEARGAIDAIGALVPVLEGRVEPQLKRDFEQALTNLRVAYADASAQASS